MFRRVLFTISVVLLYTACATSSIFPSIGNKLGNPLTLAVNSAAARLYVINGNTKDAYSTGSVQVYNITAPAAPTLVSTAVMDSFSSQIYLDVANQFLYTPNRYSANTTATSDRLLQVNINEASTGFMTITSATAGANPFGITCCTPAGLALAAALGGELDSYSLGTGAPGVTATSLNTTASDGTVYTNPQASQVAIIGAQAFVTLPTGNVFVVNLSKLGGGVSPVDYVITGVTSPRGIATDGTLIYLLSVQTSAGTSTPQLLILNPATLTARTGNTTATNVDVTTLQVKALTMGGGTTTTDPEQVVVGTNLIFVSNTGDDSVTVVNRAAQTVNASIAVGDQPFGMAIYSPAGTDTHLYVANVLGNTISIIDIAALSVAATFTGP